MKNQKNEKFLVFGVASFVFLLKLFISYHVFGTNDITYTVLFADVIDKFGALKIYNMVRIFNHPPLIAWILKFLVFLEVKTSLGFPFLYRSMSIIADFLSVFMIWKLLEIYRRPYRVLICVICAVNPINFFVSSFHGNTDPLFIFLLLCAMYFVEVRKVVLAGLFFALSASIKVVPLMMAPVFFYYLSTRRERFHFFATAMSFLLLTFIPFLMYDSFSFIRNIFFHSGLKGIWGLGRIFKSISDYGWLGLETRELFFNIFQLHIFFAPMLIVLGVTFFSYFFMRQKRLNLLEGVFFVFVFFLSVTAGFGVQYLSWLSLFAVIVFPFLGSFYVFLGGFFLFRVYMYWSGGKQPYYANSDVVGQWIGFEKTLDFILWFIVVVMLIKFFVRLNKITKTG